MTALSRSSNWPRYLVPAITAAMSSDSTRWSRSDSGHCAVGDELRQPLDDRRLADARLADQHRVVLLAARQDFHDALDLLGAADGRIELALGGELGEVAAEVVERRRLGLLLALGRGAGRARRRRCRRLRLRHVAAEEAQRLGARLLEVDAGVGQHLRRDALLLAEQAEQQVLGADVGVVELARLAHRELEHLLGARGVRQVGTGGGAAFPFLTVSSIFCWISSRSTLRLVQHRGGDALALADQAEQDVLGAHVLVVQTRGFLARHLRGPSAPAR